MSQIFDGGVSMSISKKDLARIAEDIYWSTNEPGDGSKSVGYECLLGRLSQTFCELGSNFDEAAFRKACEIGPVDGLRAQMERKRCEADIKRVKRNASRRAKDQAYRDLGLVKVRGALGGIYYE
jgi:hypothetical protein